MWKRTHRDPDRCKIVLEVDLQRLRHVQRCAEVEAQRLRQPDNHTDRHINMLLWSCRESGRQTETKTVVDVVLHGLRLVQKLR